MAETKDAPTRSAVHQWPGEIVIEFGDLKNSMMMWPPILEKVRGRWSKANMPYTQVSEQISQLPDLPGLRLRLDCRARKAVIFDPMRAEECEHELKVYQGIIKEMFRREEGPESTVVRDQLSNDSLKLELYWIRRFLDGSPWEYKDRRDPKKKTGGGPQAYLVSGDVPTMEQIKALPGRIRRNLYDPNGASKPQYWEDA